MLAFSLFAIFALAALAVDLASARAVQRRMMSAADAASLEALRWRDQSLSGDSEPASASTRDTLRRQLAQDAVSLTLGEYGAGPQFAVSPDGHWLLADPATYYPQLEFNTQSNVSRGDMVAGQYLADQAHLDGSWQTGQFVPFERADFLHCAPIAAPNASAFLVRLRRSNDANEPGIASTGQPAAMLFAVAAPLSVLVNGTPVHDYRATSLPIRATAIADGRPAVWVGPARPDLGMDGLVRVAITRAFWENTLLPIDANGTEHPSPVLPDGAQFLGSQGEVIGGYLSADTPTIGGHIVFADAPVPGQIDGLCPIIERIASRPGIPATDWRVVGFGRVRVLFIGASVMLTKRAPSGGFIAPRNASASLQLAWPTLTTASLTAHQIHRIRILNANLHDPLLAPVLTRSLE